MKKAYLSLVLLFAVVSIASAQLLPSIGFGVKGGANFSTLTDISLNSSTRAGYLVGVWGRIGGAGLHFQPELYLTSKGSEVGEAQEKGKVKFTTLDLPLLLGTRVGVGPLGARFQAGPIVSFVVDQNIGDALKDVGNFKEYKNQTFSLTGGIGVDITKITADLRYEHGISDVFKKSDDPGRLSLWTLSIGYRIF